MTVWSGIDFQTGKSEVSRAAVLVHKVTIWRQKSHNRADVAISQPPKN